MQNELQIATGSASIPLMPTAIKYLELFPADTVGMRDRYMEMRYKAAQSLAAHGIVSNLNVFPDNFGHRWDSQLGFSGDAATVGACVDALNATLHGHSRPMGNITRLASHLISFATGISFATAIVRETWWLWVFTAALAMLLGISLGVIPRLKGTRSAVAEWATIIGSLAAVADLIWTISHTSVTRP